MKRLTEKRFGKNVIPLRQNGKIKWSICSAGMGDAPTKYLYGDHADRLAAIEDILGDEYDLDRLRELAQADREGRCVVLPCKIGDIVYEIRYTAENDRPRKHARKKFDHSVSGCTWRMREQPDMCYVSEKKCTKSDFEFMGRTVFLTRADAEAALRREQDEQTKP